jgi:hypothetical protein
MTSPVREFYSKDGWHKVEILERTDGLFEVRAFAWQHEVVPGYGEVCDPYWSDISTGKTLTDTPERAQQIALEELQRIAMSPEWTSHWNNPDESPA